MHLTLPRLSAAHPVPEREAIDYREVRAILASRRITQTTLARACGIPRPTLVRFLTGASLSNASRVKLVHGLHALGLDREELPLEVRRAQAIARAS